MFKQTQLQRNFQQAPEDKVINFTFNEGQEGDDALFADKVEFDGQEYTFEHFGNYIDVREHDRSTELVDINAGLTVTNTKTGETLTVDTRNPDIEQIRGVENILNNIARRSVIYSNEGSLLVNNQNEDPNKIKVAMSLSIAGSILETAYSTLTNGMTQDEIHENDLDQRTRYIEALETKFEIEMDPRAFIGIPEDIKKGLIEAAFATNKAEEATPPTIEDAKLEGVVLGSDEVKNNHATGKVQQVSGQSSGF